jgi:hypothetical protein
MNRIIPVLLLCAWPATLPAQRPRPFEIADNSLLVEEAFNQEPGVFQNILLFQRASAGGDWFLDFTQEWPVRSQRHQASFTVPVALDNFTLGKVLLNYRFQARLEDAAGPAFSPRLSLILPTGPDDGYRWGAQVNLPVSRQYGDWYVHANAGLTWDRWQADLSGPAGVGSESRLTPHVAGSVIWRMMPLVHVLAESLARFEETPDAICCSMSFESSWVLSPGIRAAHNLGDQQLVLGVGVPFSLAGADGPSLLLYFSYELPFAR